MLDTGRNFQSPELLKEQIEVMARYKLNVFHFHFTDNPGWRLESKLYPKVTSSMTRQPGRFYTQDEFRDLVKFCRERGITLIPEMDMPAWIGFHGSSRSDRRGATSFKQGNWHSTQPWIRVNGTNIAPPVWENPAPMVKDDETPFTNEDYSFREPSMIHLKKGWNEVQLKIPHRKSDWKWMFTFIPVGDTTGLRYSSQLNPQ